MTNSYQNSPIRRLVGWLKARRVPVLDSLSPRRRKLVLWALGLLLGYAVLGFFILPIIIRNVAVKQLAKQLDREVSIRKVKLNPFAFSVTVRDLLIRDKDGQPFVSWDEVYVNLQLSSFLGHAWVFKEISTTKPYVRVQMNPDRTFNFSDLIAKFSTNASPKEAAAPSRPAALRIGRVRIRGASASLTDRTLRTPFKRTVALDLDVNDFRTDPSNQNPYSFAGTTDAGGQFAWSGHFSLDPLRSEGRLSLSNLALSKFTAVCQDLVRFDVRDGTADLQSDYRFEAGVSNTVVAFTNTAFGLHSFKLVEIDGGAEIASVPEFSITGASMDTAARKAEVGSINLSGGHLMLRREKDSAFNVVEMSGPPAGVTNVPGGVVLLMRTVTNVVAQLLGSTNAWTGTIHAVNVTNCAVSLEDFANPRAVRFDLGDIAISARHISNLPGSNCTAALSLRWDTNGFARSDLTASLSPPSVDLHLALDRIQLRPIDPYLETKFNIFILDSKLSFDGQVHLRKINEELPQVTFAGDMRLDDFSTVDGVLGEELLKWSVVRFSGMEANLNPTAVAIREIALEDVSARVLIETNGTMNLMAALHLENTNAPVTAPEAKAAKPRDSKRTTAAAESSANAPGPADLPNLSIGAVVISNAQLRFTDRSLAPEVNLTVDQLGGVITGLSTTSPAPVDVTFSARVDKVGPVEIAGSLYPFREQMTNDVKITVKNVDLTPASPYIGKFAGYRLSRGKLELNLTYHVHNRLLKSQNLIVLDQFTFGEKVDSPDATKLPVRVGVAVLKDRNGKIELDIPIEGHLDDPEFKLSRVIWHTIGNMITKVATSPFAVLGALFGGKGEELSYQDFGPGSSELPPAGREKLEGLVKGLYERPTLQVDIEGSVDPKADRDGLRRVMLAKRLRVAKWQSLRRSERETTTPDQITLPPDERLYWLKKIYADAAAKNELKPYVPDSTESGAGPNQPPAPASGAAEPAKGAMMLMQHANDSLSAPAGTPGPSGTRPPLKRSEADEMEGQLLHSIDVTDSDFQTLASARARTVREEILRSGKVEADRIFLVETQPGGVKNQGSRAYLQLK